jgi:hypothetical protein
VVPQWYSSGTAVVLTVSICCTSFWTGMTAPRRLLIPRQVPRTQHLNQTDESQVRVALPRMEAERWIQKQVSAPLSGVTWVRNWGQVLYLGDGGVGQSIGGGQYDT